MSCELAIRLGNSQTICPRQHSSFVPRFPLAPVSYLPFDEHVGSQYPFFPPDLFLPNSGENYLETLAEPTDCFACSSFQIGQTNFFKITVTFKKTLCLILCSVYNITHCSCPCCLRLHSSCSCCRRFAANFSLNSFSSSILPS